MNNDAWHQRIVGVSLALWIVWMQANGRFTLFIDALTGAYQIRGSRQVGPIAQSDQSGGSNVSQPDQVISGTFNAIAQAIPGISP